MADHPSWRAMERQPHQRSPRLGLSMSTQSPGGIFPRLTSTGNSTSTQTCSYTTESFFANVTIECKPYVEALQTCPTSSVPIRRRLEAASNAARCLDIYWRHAWYGLAYESTPSEEYLGGHYEPPDIEKNSSCTYPGFFPILNRTCSFDLSAFDNTCSDTYQGPGGANDAYLKCQNAAAEQYVRCTLQKSPDEVASCVADNAVKVDWLHQIQSYAGASTCPNANQILIVLGVGLFLQLLQTLFRVLGYHRTRQAVHRRTGLFKERRGLHQARDVSPVVNTQLGHMQPGAAQQSNYELGPTPSQDYAQKPPLYGQYMVYQHEYHPSPPPAPYHYQVDTAFAPDSQRGDGGYHSQNFESPANPWPHPWTVERVYTLKATRLLQSVGREVLVAYLTVLVLGRFGLATESGFAEELSFYLVRPRNAPFFGFLGIFEPWSQQGLAELTVDGVLSFFAGSAVASRYWSLSRHRPENPAAPYDPQLYTLAAGSVMTFVPDFVLFIVTFLVSLGLAARSMGEEQQNNNRRKDDDDGACCGLCCGAAIIWAVWMAMLAAFIAILPLVGVVEIIATIVMTIRHKRRVKKGRIDGAWELWQRKRSTWEAPLTTERTGFRVFYYFLVLGSFIINIGNWIFFASYLKLEGEMYCPPQLSGVLAMWVLVPLGIDLLFFVYRVWTQDIGYSGGAPSGSVPGLADGAVIP